MSRIFDDGRLENPEIKEKLSALKLKPNDKLIENILQEFWFHDYYNSFIAYPQILKKLEKFLTSKKPFKFNRLEFYNFLFHEIFSGKNEIFFDQMKLLSLVFELMEIDKMEIDKFEEVFQKLNLNKHTKSLNSKILLEMQLIREDEIKDENQQGTGKKAYRWIHHTITEFFVANYLIKGTKSEDFIQRFEKLAILKIEEEKIVAFKPSWSGVLRFLLESERGEETAKWIVEFLKRNKDSIDDNLSDVLSWSSKFLSKETQSSIFDLIYGEYYDRQIWIPVWTRNALGEICDKTRLQKMKSHIGKGKTETETFVHRGNVAAIIGGMLERGNSSLNKAEKEFWKEKLIAFAKDPNENGVLQRHSLDALGHFKDESLINALSMNFLHSDSLVREAFIEFCGKTAPNSKSAIHFFVEGTKNGADIYARHAMYKINTKDGMINLLHAFSSDDEFLNKFLHHESVFNSETNMEGDRVLIDLFKKFVGDRNTMVLLKKVIKLAYSNNKFLYEVRHSFFLKQIVLTIKENDKNYLWEIIEDLEKMKEENVPENKIWHYLFSCEAVFGILVEDQDFEKFKARMMKLHSSAANVVSYVESFLEAKKNE